MRASHYLDLRPSESEAAPGKGILEADRIIVGIAPSPNRPHERRNEPFGAKSHELIQALAKNFPSMYVTNFQKTPLEIGKKLVAKEQKKWAPLLYAELALYVVPGVTRILTLGSEPSKLLCPGFKSLREDHGTVFYNPELDCEVLPTFHFAAAMRNPEQKPFLKRDLQRFFEGNFIESQKFILAAPPSLPTPEVYLDIETTGLDIYEDKIISIGVASDLDQAPVYIALNPGEKVFKKLYEMVKNKILVGHNISFDLAFLEHHSQLPWTKIKVRDTMLAAFVLGETVLSLKHLVTAYTDRKGSHSGGGFEDPQYLAEDVAGTKTVASTFLKRAKQQWISSLLYQLSPRIARMRLNGVHIDWKLAEQLTREYEKKIVKAKAELDHVAGKDINWNSNDQVAKVLLKAGVPLTDMTPTGKYSVSEPTLLKFKEDYGIIQTYFNHKDLEHDLSFIASYHDLRGTDLMLHPKFNLMGAATGRSSMTDPNLQQVPRLGPIKLLFTSRFKNGFFGLVDLAQAELRIAALMANDDVLAESIMSEDIHRLNAAAIYEIPMEEVTAYQRKKSKGVTFGLLYGGSPQGLATRVGVSVAEVEKIMYVLLKSKYPKLGRYIQDQKDIAVATGQSTTPLGRIRDLRLLTELEGEGSAERKGINSPIQGTASDVMLIILNSCFEQTEKLQTQSLPIFGVHDSSMHDIHPSEKMKYVGIVQNAFRALNDTPLNQFPLWGQLPIEGELILGRNWAQVESTNEENYAPLFSYPCSNLE